MAQQKKVASEYDSYDKKNDEDAQEFLFNSLEPALAKDLQMIKNDNDSFAVVFMKLINRIHSSSANRCDELKEQLKAIKPAQFPGENLVDMGHKIRSIVKELKMAGQYDDRLALNVVESFLQAGGPGGPGSGGWMFRHALYYLWRT